MQLGKNGFCDVVIIYKIPFVATEAHQPFVTCLRYV